MTVAPKLCEKHRALEPDVLSRRGGARCPVCLMDICHATAHDVEQALGKVLGYPWYKDDQVNFPGATEADGVCIGDSVAESMADEAAGVINGLRVENRLLYEVAISSEVAMMCIDSGQSPDFSALRRDLNRLARWKKNHPGRLRPEMKSPDFGL